MTTHPTLDEPTLRELAERLLHHPHPDGPTSVELVVGGLPDSVPATLPLPAGARVSGSALYSRGDQRLSMSAVFDVPEALTVALTKCEAELTRHGWTTPEDFRPMHGGFVSSEMGEWRSYREGDQGPDLTAVVRARDGGRARCSSGSTGTLCTDHAGRTTRCRPAPTCCRDCIRPRML
jgi:hypothetical protein